LSTPHYHPHPYGGLLGWLLDEKDFTTTGSLSARISSSFFGYSSSQLAPVKFQERNSSKK
jgi:hypothetical protein